MAFPGGAITLQASVALLFLVQHFSSCRSGAAGTAGPDSTAGRGRRWMRVVIEMEGRGGGMDERVMEENQGETFGVEAFKYLERERNRCFSVNLERY